MLVYRYKTWELLLEAITFLGIGIIFLCHLVMPDLQQWWVTHLTAYLHNVMADSHWKMKVTPVEFAQRLAPIATGVTAFFFAVTLTVELMVARFWQLLLNNAGGFAKEFMRIRMGRVAAGLLVALLILLLMKIKPAVDAFPLALFPFFIAGLSLMHCWARQKKHCWLVVVLVYISVLFLPAFAVSALAVIALFDTWVNFRKKIIGS